MNILDKCGRQHDTDSFKLLNTLLTARTTGFLQDILPLASLASSICLCPVYPIVGITATTAMIIVCIATYFAGKNVMDENLRSLAMALRYIVCAADLSKAGVKDFDKYKELAVLSKASFLIPYRDGSSSNPLSLLYDYVRMITHIDLIAYKIRISGIKKHHDGIMDLYVDCGRLDACIAVASYLDHRTHCDVRFTEVKQIRAKGLYHPLIIDPVCNDLNATRGIVITGSNASGKSTFLKAVGLSSLTAASFGFAFADDFETGEFDLYSSMAVSDDLLGGDSYYVVEAKSLKRICDAAKKGSIICIVDEVLRGTNTVERIAASTRILKALSKENVLCFAATHDLELCDLLKEDMDSYYFTEEISEGNVTFPYVIYSGITDKTNAIRLLSVLGFDDDIVENARLLANGFKETGKWEMKK
jgi:DNA mismatch repair ATPase MutS